MKAETQAPVRFSRWLARPQNLIALSALLLSVCGLWIAVYEAVLIRRQQRASATWIAVSGSCPRSSKQTTPGPRESSRITASRRFSTVRRDGDLLVCEVTIPMRP